MAKAKNELIAATFASPTSSGSIPSSSRAWTSTRDVGVRHHRRGHDVGLLGIDTAFGVDRGEFVGLGPGLFGDRAPLDRQFTLDQFGLGLHRHVLTGSHRGSAGEEPGDAGDDNGVAVAGCRHTQDQRNIRHEPIADAEHGSPGSAALDVAVAVDHVTVGVSVVVSIAVVGAAEFGDALSLPAIPGRATVGHLLTLPSSPRAPRPRSGG